MTKDDTLGQMRSVFLPNSLLGRVLGMVLYLEIDL